MTVQGTQKFPVQVVLWHDAAKNQRQVFESSLTLLTTIGFLLYEDETQLALFHEMECRSDYMGGNSDFTLIPKKMVVYREDIGFYDFKLKPPSLKKLRARARAAANASAGSAALPEPEGRTTTEKG